MNLLAVILYNRAGDRRVVRFQPGALNVVTGWSSTGKSALLDIVEFCLGRDSDRMPVGPITETVAWYAVLVQLPTTRAFLARPAPPPGRSSTQQAMFELGADLEPLDASNLRVNADSASVRQQLSRAIGIGENRHESGQDAIQAPLEANIAHALFLCFQGQGEIGNRDLLFHRQGERGIRDAIANTLPYFLGAVPIDQALKRQQLTAARREMRRLQADLNAAERLNRDVDVELRALLSEAAAQGLVPTEEPDGRNAMVRALTQALGAGADLGVSADADNTERHHALEGRRADLRRELRDLNDQRALLNDEADGQQGYEAVAQASTSRLQSLGLIASDQGASEACPMCGQELSDPDPNVAQLTRALNDLSDQLRATESSRPRRAAALIELDMQADTLRQELRAIESESASLRAADQALGAAQRRTEQQAFTKGRIDLYLSKLRQIGNDEALARLRERVGVTRHRIEGLEAALDPAEEYEQMTSRLFIVARDMTTWAQELQLEHGAGNVRLDMAHLTVVTDTSSGPTMLFRVGSAKNWIGYHLVAHLALHRYFVRQRRPVPHFLMLDQPTQAFYPSEVEKRDGVAADDDDRAAVRRLFELMRDVAADLAPRMQIIVCDHANLPEPWFQEAVRHNWRGEALIPQEWIESSEAHNGPA